MTCRDEVFGKDNSDEGRTVKLEISPDSIKPTVKAEGKTKDDKDWVQGRETRISRLLEDAKPRLGVIRGDIKSQASVGAGFSGGLAALLVFAFVSSPRPPGAALMIGASTALGAIIGTVSGRRARTIVRLQEKKGKDRLPSLAEWIIIVLTTALVALTILGLEISMHTAGPQTSAVVKHATVVEHNPSSKATRTSNASHG